MYTVLYASIQSKAKSHYSFRAPSLLPPRLDHRFPGRYAPVVVVSTENGGGLSFVLGDEAVLSTELAQSEVEQRYVVVGAVINQTHAQ